MQTRTIRTTRTSHPGRLPGTGGSTERAAVSGHRPNSYHIPPADRIRTNTRTSFLPIKTMENANSYHSYDSYESSGSAARGGWVWGKAALNGHRPNSYHTLAAQRYLLRKYVWCACDPCNKTLPHLRCRLYLPCLRLHRTPFSRQSTAALSDVNTVSFSIHIILRLKFLWFMLGIIGPFLGFVAYPKCMKRKTASGATMRSSLRLSTRGVELCYILNCNEFIGAHPKVPTLRGTTFCDATHGEAVKFFPRCSQAAAGAFQHIH